MQPFGLEAGCLLCIPLWFSGFCYHHNTVSTPFRCHARLSSATSHIPITTIGLPRLRLRSGIRCVLTVASGGFSVEDRSSFFSSFLVLRVLSSALLPGFIGPDSSVLLANLPPSVPIPASGSPSRFGFIGSSATSDPSTGGLHWVRHTSLPVSRPTSQRFASPDIRTRLVTTARPRPLCHIVGSLSATYTGSASCFLQTPHFWNCPCLVGVTLPSGNGGLLGPPLSVVRTAGASCQTHMNYPAHRAGHLKKVLTTWHCRPLCLTPLWNLSNNLLELNLVILSETKDLLNLRSYTKRFFG